MRSGTPDGQFTEAIVLVPSSEDGRWLAVHLPMCSVELNTEVGSTELEPVVEFGNWIDSNPSFINRVTMTIQAILHPSRNEVFSTWLVGSDQIPFPRKAE